MAKTYKVLTAPGELKALVAKKKYACQFLRCSYVRDRYRNRYRVSRFAQRSKKRRSERIVPTKAGRKQSTTGRNV